MICSIRLSTRGSAQLAPAILISRLLPGFFGDSATSVYWLQTLTSFYILWAAVRICVIFIGNLYKAILRRDNLRVYAVKGVFEMLKLIIIGVGVIIGLSLLIGRSPLAIITALLVLRLPCLCSFSLRHDTRTCSECAASRQTKCCTAATG